MQVEMKELRKLTMMNTIQRGNQNERKREQEQAKEEQERAKEGRTKGEGER